MCSAGWQSTWIIVSDLAYSRWGPPPTRSLHWFGEIKLLTPCSSITTARHVNNVWRCEMWEYTILPDSEDLCGQMSHFDRFRKCQSTIGHFQLWESAWNDFSEHCTFHSKYCKTLLPYLTTALCADLVWPPERDLVQFPHPPLRRPSNYQTITERRRRWENSPHRGSHVHSSRACPWWR